MKENSETIKLIPIKSNKDNRGYSIKNYDRNYFKSQGVDFEPLETLTIFSKANAFRGLHFQRVKKQERMITLISGKIYIVAVNCEANCGEIGHIWTCILDNRDTAVLIPGNYALGTVALEDSCFLLMCSGYQFNQEYSCGIRYDSSDLQIEWPISELIVSEKDMSWPTLEEYINNRIEM